jgi:hypothetical protein
MARRGFNKPSPLPKQIKRRAKADLAVGIDAMQAQDGQTLDINRASYAITSLLALLRLSKKALNAPTYQRETKALNQIKIALDRLHSRTPTALKRLAKDQPGLIDKDKLHQLRECIDADQQQNINAEPERLRTIADLTEICIRCAYWQIEAEGFATLEPGLRSTYVAAKKQSADLTIHRKANSTSQLRSQLECLVNCWPSGIEPHIKALKKIEKNLIAIQGYQELAEMIDEDQAVREASQLQCRKLLNLNDKLLSRIFAETPRGFTRRIEAYWQAWVHEGEHG